MSSDLSRRQFLKSMGSIGLTFGLAGCASPTPRAPTPSGATSAPAAKPTTKLTGIQLRAMIIQFGYTTGLLPQLAAFEAETGIKAEIEEYGISEEFAKADVELASGASAYDLISLNVGNFPRAARAGWIQTLDEYIANPAMTDAAELNVDDYYKGALGAFKHEGKLYGLPNITGLQVLYARTDLLEKAGIKKIPSTFEELAAAAKELHGKEGAVGIAMRTSRGLSQNVWSHLQFLFGLGASLVKKYPEDMHPNLDSAEMIKAVTYLTDLMSNYSLPSIATVQAEDVATNLMQGKVALVIEGAPFAGRVFDKAQSKVTEVLDVAMVPSGPAGHFPPVDCHAWVIPMSAKQKEASWKFMQWATSTAVQLKAGVEGPHASPTRSSVSGDQTFRNKYSYANGHWLEAYEKTLALGADYYGASTYRLPIPEWPEFEDRLSIALNEALTKSKTPEQAMKDAQADITALLKSAGYFSA